MIDHTGLEVSDPVASRAFYDKALAALGYQMMVQIPKEHTGGAAVFGYGVPPKPDFWVNEGTPNDPRLQSPSVPKPASRWTSSTKLRFRPGERTMGARVRGRTITRTIM